MTETIERASKPMLYAIYRKARKINRADGENKDAVQFAHEIAAVDLAMEAIKQAGFKVCNSYYETQAALEAKDAEIARLRGQIDYLADEARRFADFYEQGSDGRNTFVVFASKIKAALTPLEGEAS